MIRYVNHRNEWPLSAIKRLKRWLALAIKQNLLHEREPDWADQMLDQSNVWGLLENDQLVAMIVMRGEVGGEYCHGESAMWRGPEYWEPLREMITHITDLYGGTLYGAFYRHNQVASEFYFDYDRITPEELPADIYEELEHYFSEIQLIRKVSRSTQRLGLGLQTSAG